MNGQNKPEMTARQARELLAAYAEWHRGRDQIIRQVAAAGISTAEICRATGHAKTTITAILDRQETPR